MTSGQGKVKSVNLSPSKGGPKAPCGGGILVAGMGFAGDGHAGPGPKQVSLLAWESALLMRAKGADVRCGSFGENITTTGIDLGIRTPGERLRIGGGALLEVTEIGKKCPAPCAIYRAVGDCIMPREGIFCRVLAGGSIRGGDPIVPLQTGDEGV
ncbi:MAG: MOSC domain-containing protein [Candidatus Aureabacteria bacterium]|nr:MOSC domain-containing protein [Candidatus Auribacterota bacterium]